MYLYGFVCHQLILVDKLVLIVLILVVFNRYGLLLGQFEIIPKSLFLSEQSFPLPLEFVRLTRPISWTMPPLFA